MFHKFSPVAAVLDNPDLLALILGAMPPLDDDPTLGVASYVCRAWRRAVKKRLALVRTSLVRPWSSEWTAHIALSGHLAVLQWARANGAPWDEHTCTQAAGGGHLAVLQWLRAQTPPCPWNSRACTVAAARGQLAALQWLRGQAPPAPWSGFVCAYAAVGGRLEILQWARKHGAPWDRAECLRYAIDNGHPHIVTWLEKQAD